MKAEFMATIKKDGDWWLGWVEEVPGAKRLGKDKIYPGMDASW